jgi:tryptophanyl-tRNA synthetase
LPDFLFLNASILQIMADEGYLRSVLKDGREKAGAIANQTLAKVKAALGYSVLL